MMIANLPMVLAPHPHLPAEARSRDGAVFDSRRSRWAFRTGTRNVSFNFELVRGIDESILPSFKAVILWYIENKSARHANGIFIKYRHLFLTLSTLYNCNISLIDCTAILNYKSALSASKSWYLSSLAGAVKKWCELGWPGVDPEVVRLLDGMRLKGCPKGEAVRTMDPISGPFTDIERQALADALKNTWSAGEISLEENLLAWLAILLAPRPVQLAALKVSDLIISTGADGGKVYILRVPRAKQRETTERGQFTNRALIPGIGELLASYLDQLRTRLRGMVPDVEQAPMFPAKHPSNWPLGFEWHSTSYAISWQIVRILEGLDVNSERTGKPLNINAQRLRRTRGTHAAMEGHGELVIAALLDHTDTQNVGVYVESRPEIIERIDRALAIKLAPLAQAFAGVLVEGAADLDNSQPVVADPRVHDGSRPTGTCGKHGFCGLAAPIACYTCRHFQAWLDGPHEAVLDHLLHERERQVAQGSKRVASVNDRTILAVAEVIALCAERRAALAEAEHD
jgi:integrase